MRANGKPRDLVIDLLVPASVASRYRARLVAASSVEAEIVFYFCPSVFRSGVLESCPASLSVGAALEFVQLGGILRVERTATAARGRVRFSPPASSPEIETLQRLCGVDPRYPASAAQPSADPHQASTRAAAPSGAPSGDAAPAWLRVVGG